MIIVHNGPNTRKAMRIDKYKGSFVLCFCAIVLITMHTVVCLSKQRSSVAEALSQETVANLAFANFREVRVGNVKDGILYRSASPVDNTNNRASTVEQFVSSTRIQYVVNLAENEESLNGLIGKDGFNSWYYVSLYESGKVALLHMNMHYKEREFEEKLVRGLTMMAENDGPYLVHCLEGKDRTGYVMMMIEALMGASYNEIVNDYMTTYDNFYGVNRESDLAQYDEIKEKNIDEMLHYLIKDEGAELESVSDYSGYAREYLKRIGMDEEKIQKLVEKLKK